MAYISAATLRAQVPALADVTLFPDATLTALVAEFEEVAEDYRGVAYEPRTVTQTILVDDTTSTLVLRFPQLVSVTSLTIDGAAVTVADLVLDKPAGTVRYDGGFSRDAEVVVVYVHGFAAPPALLLRACREYVRSAAMSDATNTPRDVIGQSFDGTFTRFSTPDRAAGRPTGWLEVDRLLNSLPNFRLPGMA